MRRITGFAVASVRTDNDVLAVHVGLVAEQREGESGQLVRLAVLPGAGERLCILPGGGALGWPLTSHP